MSFPVAVGNTPTSIIRLCACFVFASLDPTFLFSAVVLFKDFPHIMAVSLLRRYCFNKFLVFGFVSFKRSTKIVFCERLGAVLAVAMKSWSAEQHRNYVFIHILFVTVCSSNNCYVVMEWHQSPSVCDFFCYKYVVLCCNYFHFSCAHYSSAQH